MNAYREHLNQFLADLTSKSLYIAISMIFQIPRDNNNDSLSSRDGLATVLVKRLDAGNAPGLQALSDKEKADLRELDKKEQESLRK